MRNTFSTFSVFTKQGWLDGWKSLGCDSTESMKATAGANGKLSKRLREEPGFFKSVYLFAFEFTKTTGQRSIPLENALAFWEILLPYVSLLFIFFCDRRGIPRFYLLGVDG